MSYVFAFVLGLVAMDLLWAFRLGIPQQLWRAWQRRNDQPPEIG